YSRRNVDACRRSTRRTHGSVAWPKVPLHSCVSRRIGAMSDPHLDRLAEELAEFASAEKEGGRSPRDERTIAGFEEIQRFVDTHGRAPQHGEDRDIFERLYAVRLDRLRALGECHTLLAAIDHQGLLAGAPSIPPYEETINEDELVAEL